ncbi:spectinomycin phosphotransferase [Kribbella steppae]|uniref:Spectinomycin phosphotransferase n=1 Tax=Kribbella steppae TaxID=2512223 RepID=A0A4R2HJS5_9ACTN|nr:spectinomycin phosphotransferase [Kribbella steppae]
MLAGVRKLQRWVLEDFGLDVVELSPVGHGADVAAQVWRAATATNTYAVKWSGAGTNTGHQVAAYLADVGLQGIPELIRTMEGGLWSFHGKKRLTITPWIDGVRAAETGLTTEQWTEYGVLLQRVHSSELPERLRDALPRHSPVDARIPGLAAQLQTRLTTQAPEDDLEAELAAVWKEHQDTIAHLLTARPPEPGGRKVVCHADPHLGNVLVDGHVHLIDWDDVVLAPREQDLMFMLGGMGSIGPTTPEQLTAFFTGYGDVDLDQDAIAYYRHTRALEDVALWAEQALTGPDREDCVDILSGVLGAGGLARLALP